MNYLFHEFTNRDLWQAEAVKLISSCLKIDIRRYGHVSLLCSGGSTPGPVYQSLSESGVNWEKVTIGLVDERWVDEDDPGSNAAGLRQSLLTSHARRATFIPMKNAALTAYDGQAQVQKDYQAIKKPYTIAVLGMGIDGHTASWFPEAEGLDDILSPDNTNIVQAITAKPSAVTGDYLERMTLTYSALSQCDSLILLMTGRDKRAVLETAQEQGLPISRLFGHGMTVLWAP